MTNKTVLSDEKLEAAARNHGTGGWQTLASMKVFAREIEQAVLQSPEIQQALKDAGRYRWLRNEAWAGSAHNKPQVKVTFYGDTTILAEEAVDETIDAAMEQKP